MSDHQIRLRLTPLREFTMLHIMNALSDKVGWDEKVRVITGVCWGCIVPALVYQLMMSSIDF